MIFCAKHNREQTITPEFEIGTGHGRGGCDMIYLSIILISAIKYSCTIYIYINITRDIIKVFSSLNYGNLQISLILIFCYIISMYIVY